MLPYAITHPVKTGRPLESVDNWAVDNFVVCCSVRFRRECLFEMADIALKLQ